MKLWRIAVVGLLCIFAFASCRRSPAAFKPLSGPPQVGALYSFNDGEGGFRAGKVLAAEDDVIFVRFYANRWTVRPSLAEARIAGNAIFLAFSSQTFAGMQPVHLENGTVLAEESSEYEVWKQSNQNVF